MLSNKLTFSLVLVLVFAFVAVSAMAQVPDTDVVGAVAKDGFSIVGRTAAPDGVDATAVATGSSIVDGANMPNLAELLRFGGTIELQLHMGTVKAAADAAKGASASATADEKKKSKWQRAVISEIMWAEDRPAADADARDDAQWIEIYNHTGAALVAADVGTPVANSLRLVYYTVRNSTGADAVIETDFDDEADAAAEVAADVNDDGIDDDSVWVLVDRVSTINRFGSLWSPPGQNGNSDITTGAGQDRDTDVITDFISMYRKITLDSPKLAYKVKKAADGGGLDGIGDGTDAGQWAASVGIVNTDSSDAGAAYIATPFAVHRIPGGAAQSFSKAPGSLSLSGIIFNEVRNDNSEANLDWIELYYYGDPVLAAGVTATAALPVNIENYEINMVTAVGTEAEVVEFPKYKLSPGDHLVIYNRHPGDTILAGGVNIMDVAAGSQVNKGASHLYYVSSTLDLPSDKKFLLLLRSAHDKNQKPDAIVDFVGNGFFSANKKVGDVVFNTDVWPLNGWTTPEAAGFGDNTFADANASWERDTSVNDNGVLRPHSLADGNRSHGDSWKKVEAKGGVGYDRDVDLNSAPGTPGYVNAILDVISDDRDDDAKKKPYAFSGTVTISEIMYDAGPRWNLVQWIELYNSSMTDAIDVGGWELEIRNKEDVESYVDSSFAFEAGTEILPNQTLLLVSGTGANDVDSNRVYNLYQHHRQALGLLARDSVLLSRTGFYLSLKAKISQGGESKMMMVDEAGNVMVEGAKRTVAWELPGRDPAARQSLIRQYGSRAIDGTADAADDGAMATSWMQSDVAGAGLAYYGHRNDIGTPGFRLGGPLPVSLATFRPLRDKATGEVVITWVTESELNNAGFNILRADSKDGEFKVINLQGMIAGHGTTSEKHVYTYTDKTAKPNVAYYYQIEDVSLNGNRTTLRTTHMRGNVNASGKLATTWSDLKLQK